MVSSRPVIVTKRTLSKSSPNLSGWFHAHLVNEILGFRQVPGTAKKVYHAWMSDVRQKQAAERAPKQR
jgi:hypothetical protein